MSRYIKHLTRFAKDAKFFNSTKFSLSRNFSLTSNQNAKVTLVGACGGIGQPLALLLKHNPLILNLDLMDVKDPQGVAMDLSHIDTKAKVNTVEKPSNIDVPFKGTDLIVITAGLPRKPGMSRDDLFSANAKIVFDILLMTFELEVMPKIAIVTNPVNSIIPMAFEVLSTKFPEDTVANRLFGVTTLDIVRASTFYGQHLGKDPREIIVPVIGGHSDTTICPMFSLSNIPLTDESQVTKLVDKIRKAGTEVVNAKGGDGSATLSMAYAASRFVNSVLEAHYGKHPTECTFIHSKAHKDLNFFAEMTRLNTYGVESILPQERANSFDLSMLDKIAPILKNDIKKGVDFAKANLPKEFKEMLKPEVD